MVAKVPRPRIFVIDDDSPNAFATGISPEKAAVAVTTGLLQRLNREELEGVLAHEFAHIRNYDVRLQTIAIALGAVIAILVQFGSRMMFFGRSSRRSKDEDNGIAAIMMVISILAMILGPFMSTILQLAISRNREYLADATAVEFTRNPQGLISALKKSLKLQRWKKLILKVQHYILLILLKREMKRKILGLQHILQQVIVLNV